MPSSKGPFGPSCLHVSYTIPPCPASDTDRSQADTLVETSLHGMSTLRKSPPPCLTTGTMENVTDKLLGVFFPCFSSRNSRLGGQVVRGRRKLYFRPNAHDVGFHHRCDGTTLNSREAIIRRNVSLNVVRAASDELCIPGAVNLWAMWPIRPDIIIQDA